MTRYRNAFQARKCLDAVSFELQMYGRKMHLDGIEIGELHMEDIDEDLIVLRSIQIHPELQGQGLGSRALSILTAAADGSVCRIALEAFWRPGTEDGGWLPRWYGKHGFTLTDGPDEHHLAGFERIPEVIPVFEPSF